MVIIYSIDESIGDMRDTELLLAPNESAREIYSLKNLKTGKENSIIHYLERKYRMTREKYKILSK